jgi:ribosome-binding factor A
MSKKYERRISDLIRQHVCDLIERELKDPRVEGVTVTDIELSPDTRHATVFYSMIGDDTQKEDAQIGLRSASGWISRELGKRLRTRNTPHIVFEFDPSLERGDRMSQLLDEIKTRDAERPLTPIDAPSQTQENSQDP